MLDYVLLYVLSTRIVHYEAGTRQYEIELCIMNQDYAIIKQAYELWIGMIQSNSLVCDYTFHIWTYSHGLLTLSTNTMERMVVKKFNAPTTDVEM